MIKTELTFRQVGSLLMVMLVLLGISYCSGYSTGYDKGGDVAYQAAYDEGVAAGHAKGLADGERVGYGEGYRDRARNRPDKVAAGTWRTISDRRDQTRRGYMRVSAAIALMLIFYWAPFLLKRSTATELFPGWMHLRGITREFTDPAFRHGTIGKLLLAVASLIVMWLLLPGTLLARVSSLYVKAVPSELLVTATGVLASILLVRLVELSTTRVRNAPIALGLQLAWTAVFTGLLYQFAGGLGAAGGAAAASGIDMLLLQAGMALGMAVYLLGRFSYTAWTMLRSRNRARVHASVSPAAAPPPTAGTAAAVDGAW